MSDWGKKDLAESERLNDISEYARNLEGVDFGKLEEAIRKAKQSSEISSDDISEYARNLEGVDFGKLEEAIKKAKQSSEISSDDISEYARNLEGVDFGKLEEVIRKAWLDGSFDDLHLSEDMDLEEQPKTR